MFKAFIIKWAASAIFDATVGALEEATKKSTNPVDDKLVQTVKDSKEDIINALKKK
jgi:hypothetical protein